MEKFYRNLGIGFFASLLVAAFSLLTALPFMVAWNYATPAVFGWPSIGYWQAFALLWVVRSAFPMHAAEGK